MQVFELHFNPEDKQDTICESFCYEPDNIYEKKLGHFYIVGQISSGAHQNTQLLANLAQKMKSRYYSLRTSSPATALRAALKQGNKFLEDIVKRGNVSWLGNLQIVVFTLKKSKAKKKTSFYFNFTKVGKIKMFLAREQGLVEIGKELELQEMDPYPFKIFFNIASGRLKENDRILVCTDSLFEKKQAAIQQITLLPDIKEKKIKEILANEPLSEEDDLSGICFLTNLASRVPHLRQQRLTLQKERKSFFEKIKMPQLKAPQFIHDLRNRRHSEPKAKNLCVEILRAFALRMTTWEANYVSRVIKIIKNKFAQLISPIKTGSVKTLLPLKKIPLKKHLFLILLLLFCLLTGFLLFQRQKAKSLRVAQEHLAKIESKMLKAETFLILKQEIKANVLFQEAWVDFKNLARSLPQITGQDSLAGQVSQLENTLEKNLSLLNKLEIIKEPEVLLEYPQKARVAHSSSKQALFKFSQEDFALYYLNSDSGQIIKYPYNLNSGWAFPEQWLKQEVNAKPPTTFSRAREKVVGGKSIAIDGSIRVLDKANQVHRFYQGLYQETVEVEIFPPLQTPTKLWTSPKHSNLYLLEPGQNRLIILSKQGQIIKQFQSEKFNNLLDFRVSPDAKTIWLLNGSRVYELSF